MDVWQAVLRALWLFLPCYMANMAPVAAARAWPRWDRPLDGGRVARDGRALLGPNKTWRGLVAGIVAGSMTALLLAPFARGPWIGLDFGLGQGAPVPGFVGVALFGALLGLGALAGDAAKSFAKRRLARAAGSRWFPFDQLDFVAGGLVAAAAGSPLVGGWALHAYFGDALVLVALVAMTPALHLASSVLAYWGGLKRAPW